MSQIRQRSCCDTIRTSTWLAPGWRFTACRPWLPCASASVVGAVSMDLTTIDVTDIAGASVGDEVILWGESGGEVISVNDVARLAQTISYEMLCTVGKRVPRVVRS